MPQYDTKKKKQMTLLFKKPLLVLLAHKRTLRRAGKTTYLYRPNYKAHKKKKRSALSTPFFCHCNSDAFTEIWLVSSAPSSVRFSLRRKDVTTLVLCGSFSSSVFCRQRSSRRRSSDNPSPALLWSLRGARAERWARLGAWKRPRDSARACSVQTH